MTINKLTEGTKVTIKLEGRLDTTTAPQLDAELKDVLPAASDLVFDFTSLEYISSAGLRVILASYKTMSAKGTMVIKNVNDTIMEIFEVTGFSDILNIEA